MYASCFHIQVLDIFVLLSTVVAVSISIFAIDNSLCVGKLMFNNI